VHSSSCQQRIGMTVSFKLTIAIHRAMGTWLLPIALDFLPSTLITGTRHSPPLLEMCCWFRLRRTLSCQTGSGGDRGGMRRLLLHILILGHGLSITGNGVIVVLGRSIFHNPFAIPPRKGARSGIGLQRQNANELVVSRQAVSVAPPCAM
jgi:hypothetical protein